MDRPGVVCVRHPDRRDPVGPQVRTKHHFLTAGLVGPTAIQSEINGHAGRAGPVAWLLPLSLSR